MAVYIRAEPTGRIEVLSIEFLTGSELYTDAIPADLFSLVGLGKYLFNDGEIKEVPGWTMPQFEIPGP